MRPGILPKKYFDTREWEEILATSFPDLWERVFLMENLDSSFFFEKFFPLARITN
jgi:septation ring formation regulator EzrA